MWTAACTRRERDVRRLVLLRHAKSDYPPGIPDHDRPLADRGRRDAPAAGEWIAGHVGDVDRVLVSSAARAQQTWALVAPHVSVLDSVITEPGIYEASTAELVEIVGSLPDTATTVVLVGHNPGFEDLAARLAVDGDPDAIGRMAVKYPTSGIALLDAEGTWADLVRGARLSAFAVPRG